MKLRKILLSLVILHFSLCLAGENYSRADTVDLGVAIKLRWFFNPKGNGGSNYSVSASFSVSRNIMIEKKWFWQAFPFWQVSANIYSNGLGTNLLPSLKRTQLDIVNSVGLSNGFGKLPGKENLYLVQPFNFMTSSAMMHDVFGFNFTFGSNFIVNNHRRNQQVGFVNVGLRDNLQVSFYNDGPPFHVIGLADGHDRWWTGGGRVQLNFDITPGEKKFWQWLDRKPLSKHFHSFYYLFDRFTGDVQDAYVLSNHLFLDKVPTKDKAQNFFNRGQTIFGFRHSNGTGLSVALIGDYKIDVQDWIHNRLRYAKHFSLARKSWHIGIDFQRFLVNEPINFPK